MRTGASTLFQPQIPTERKDGVSHIASPTGMCSEALKLWGQGRLSHHRCQLPAPTSLALPRHSQLSNIPACLPTDSFPWLGDNDQRLYKTRPNSVILRCSLQLSFIKFHQRQNASLNRYYYIFVKMMSIFYCNDRYLLFVIIISFFPLCHWAGFIS